MAASVCSWAHLTVRYSDSVQNSHTFLLHNRTKTQTGMCAHITPVLGWESRPGPGQQAAGQGTNAEVEDFSEGCARRLDAFSQMRELGGRQCAPHGFHL